MTQTQTATEQAPARPSSLEASAIVDGTTYTVLQGYGSLAPNAIHYLVGVDGATYTFKGGVCRNVPARVARLWLDGGEEESPLQGIKRYIPATGNIRVLPKDATERDFVSASPSSLKDITPVRAGSVLKGLSPRELVQALGAEDAALLVQALAAELGLNVSSTFTGTSRASSSRKA